MADIDRITINELDVADLTEDGDKLIIQTADGRAKSVSKKNLLSGEAYTREVADALLQNQIITLAGKGEQEEKANLSLKGAANGLAELDENGKVPMSQIPGGADDVRPCYGAVTWDELGNVTDIQVYEDEPHTKPLVPDTHIIYLDIGETKSKNYQYMWSGNGWGRLGNSLILGESSSNAYRGDRGKAAYDHSLERGTGAKTSTNPHGLSKGDIGLGNVPNVATDNQTPTYTPATSNAELKSGETLSAAFGKLAAAVKSLIAHLADKNNPHFVTKEQIGLGNVSNVATTGSIASGSGDNITSGAVYTALGGKLNSSAGAVGTASLAKASVTTEKLADGAVADSKLEKQSVWAWIKTNTLPIASGGTGATTANAAMNALMQGTSEMDSPNDREMILAQRANNGTCSKYTLGKIWGWIKSKLGSLALLSTNGSTSQYLRGDGTWQPVVSDTASKVSRPNVSSEVVLVEASGSTDAFSLTWAPGNDAGDLKLTMTDDANSQFRIIQNGAQVLQAINGVCNINGNAATASLASRIPASQPSNLQDGMIWLA